MIREICKDETFLAQKAEPATPDDLSIAADLLETLEHHKDGCVGMAANMIGVNKRIIAFDNEGDVYKRQMVQTAKTLVEATGMGKVFFANSGAEANEGAIKLARKYS